MNVDQLVTPYVTVSKERVFANITAMAEKTERAGVALRPHVKTHNVPELAHLQLKAGAAGITVATTREARLMASAGITDIFIARQVLDPAALSAVAVMAETIDISLGVDSSEAVQAVAAAAAAAGVTIPVLIEVDSGGKRCGISEAETAIGLASSAAGIEGVSFGGIFTHEGHVYGAGDRNEIAVWGARAAAMMTDLAAELTEAGFPPERISIGSSPSARAMEQYPGITEIRPGNYIFNDGMQEATGLVSFDQCALRVTATVISVTGRERAVVNVGSKLMGSDTGGKVTKAEGYGRVIAPENHPITRIYEEHGVIEEEHTLTPGQLVTVVPTHACLLANLAPELYYSRNDGFIESVWPNRKFQVRL